MNERIKDFLAVKHEEEKKKFEEEKQKTLIELGLYEKVYSENSEYSPDFPNLDYEGENNSKWFKKVGIEVSDKEYEEIKKYAKIEADDSTANNPIAIILTIIAWVTYGIGFFAGLGIIEEYGFGLPFVFWCVALISGTTFLGFAEIIKLLTAIKNK